jgi:hypothetical protein
VGWWNHGFQIPSQDQGKGKAYCQGGCPENDLGVVLYSVVSLCQFCYLLKLKFFCSLDFLIITTKTFVIYNSRSIIFSSSYPGFIINNITSGDRILVQSYDQMFLLKSNSHRSNVSFQSIQSHLPILGKYHLHLLHCGIWLCQLKLGN